MITIIKKAEKEQEQKMYKVTCHVCKSVFTCESNDFSHEIMGHGVYEKAVICPVCGNHCTGWYGIDQIEEV